MLRVSIRKYIHYHEWKNISCNCGCRRKSIKNHEKCFLNFWKSFIQSRDIAVWRFYKNGNYDVTMCKKKVLTGIICYGSIRFNSTYSTFSTTFNPQLSLLKRTGFGWVEQPTVNKYGCLIIFLFRFRKIICFYIAGRTYKHKHIFDNSFERLVSP